MAKKKSENKIGRPRYDDALYKQAQVRYAAYNLVVHNAGKTEGWKATPFHTYLCDEVQRFVEKPSTKPYEILIVSTPPQHGKSLTITETLPSWYLGHHPEDQVIAVSYNADFAQKFGKRNREKVADFGDSIFGISLDPSSKASHEWELTDGGGMKSVGFGGSITGRKGNLIIIDDPIKSASESKSEAYRNKIWDEWSASVKTRTHPGSKIIVIMTRWHEDDLAGRLIENENCKVINLPAECDSKNDPLKRKIGDALCPEIGKDNTWLKQFKESYVKTDGISAWYALFQGQPVADGGNIFKKEWWKYYEVTDSVISGMDELLMSVDAAFKDTNDPVCIQVWGKKRADMYLIDMVNDRIDFPKTVMAVKGMKLTYKSIRQILIEDKANGSAVIATLRGEIPGIIPITPLGGKVARANDVTFAVESGNVYLPENRSWTNEFVAQCSAFPNGKHDDMVDAMTQALTRLTKHNTHEKKKEKSTIMDFFGKPKKKPLKTGLGEKVNVV